MAIPSATNAELRMMRLDPVDKIDKSFNLRRDASECGSILGFINKAPIFEWYVLIHLFHVSHILVPKYRKYNH
jgi:hypothetical protein